MEKKSVVVKEWCAVVDALGQGKQTILMRKYPPTYMKFFLYPTYGFAIRKNYLSQYFQPQHHDFIRKSIEIKEKGKTRIQFYAEMRARMRVVLYEVWQNLSKAEEILDKALNRNQSVFEFERVLAN